MQYKYLVDLPFDSHQLSQGFSTQERYEVSRKIMLGLMRGQTRLMQLANTYSDSYNSSEFKTVLHYRDLLISKAIEASLVNVQFAKSNKSQLTGQSEKVWSKYEYDDVWTYIAPFTSSAATDFLYSGLLGSPAFLLQDINCSDLYPIEFLSVLGKNFWGFLGVDFELSPNKRIDDLLSKVKFNQAVIESVEQVYIANINSVEGRSILAETSDVIDLGNQFLLGVYNPSLFNVVRPYLPTDVYRAATNLVNNLLSIAKPGGFLLVLQNLIVESYNTASQAILTLPQDVLTQDFNYFSATPGYEEIKYKIATSLALGYEAINFLNMFDALPTSLDFISEQMYFWLSVSGYTEIQSPLETLVPNLILLSDQIDINSPYSKLQGLPPKGSSSLVISTSNYVGNSFLITVQNSDSEVSVLNQYNLNTNDTASVQITKLDSENYRVTSTGSGGYAALFASPTNVSNYNSITDASNVIVLQIPNAPVVAATSSSAGLLDQQLPTYNTLFNLDTLSNPRGSTTDSYKSRGFVNPSATDYRAYQEAARDSLYSTRTEIASRLNGLGLQTKNVHIDSEVKTLTDWASKIGDTECLGSYKTAQEQFQKSLVVVQTKAQKQDYGSGNEIENSTATKNFTGLSARYTLGTSFDVYAPSTQINSEHVIFTAQNTHLQSKLIRNSATYIWNRAESLIVNETNCIFNYITDNFYNGAPNYITVVGDNKTYSDCFTLQVGQEQAPISIKARLSGTYGSFSALVQQDVLFKTKFGGFTIDALANIGMASKASIGLSATQTLNCKALISGTFDGGATANVTSKLVTNINSLGLVNISALGITNVDGAIVNIALGSTGEVKEPVDIDLAEQAPTLGGVTNYLSADTFVAPTSLLSDITLNSSSLSFGTAVGELASSVASNVGSFTDIASGINTFVDQVNSITNLVPDVFRLNIPLSSSQSLANSILNSINSLGVLTTNSEQIEASIKSLATSALSSSLNAASNSTFGDQAKALIELSTALANPEAAISFNFEGNYPEIVKELTEYPKANLPGGIVSSSTDGNIAVVPHTP